jgi:hypothetical protein
MARGFESKSVADQQAEAENRRASACARRPSRQAAPPPQPRAARADAVHRIEQATDERYRAMLQQALAALDVQLSALRYAARRQGRPGCARPSRARSGARRVCERHGPARAARPSSAPHPLVELARRTCARSAGGSAGAARTTSSYIA